MFNKLSSKTAKLVSLLIWMLLLGYIWHIREAFSPLLTLAPSMLFLLATLTIAQLLLQISIFPLMLSELGEKLKWTTWLPLGVLTTTASMFVPAQGGTAIRSIYLKKKHNVTYSTSVAIVGFQSIVRILCYVSVASITLVLFTLHSSYDNSRYLLAGLLIVASIVLFGWFFREKLIGIITHNWLNQLLQQFLKLSNNRYLLTITCFYNLLVLLCNAAIFAILFHIFNIPITITVVLLYTAMKFLFLLFNVLPGNLGISEIITGFLTTILHGDFNTGVAAAVCARAISMACALLASFLSYLAIQHSKSYDKG